MTITATRPMSANTIVRVLAALDRDVLRALEADVMWDLAHPNPPDVHRALHGLLILIDLELDDPLFA